MAKKTRKGAGARSRKGADKPPPAQQSTKLISKEKWERFWAERKRDRARSREIAKSQSESTRRAIDNDGLNRRALRIIDILDPMESNDRLAVIFHVNGLSRYLGYWDQGDLFHDSKEESEGERDLRPDNLKTGGSDAGDKASNVTSLTNPKHKPTEAQVKDIADRAGAGPAFERNPPGEPPTGAKH